MDTFSTLTCEGREFLIKSLSSFNVSHLVDFYIVCFYGASAVFSEFLLV